MLAFAVRGVVLLSVLSWYSATIWRMIDGYFKDQFRVYLQDEYRQHPRMQADIGSVGDVDKRSIPDVLPAEPSPNRGVEETYGPDAVTRTRTTTTSSSSSSSSSSCPADITDACRRLPSHGTSGKPEEEVTGGTSENAAVRADKNAFPKNAARSTLESRKPSSSGKHEGRRLGTINQDADHKRKATERRSKIELASSTASSRQRCKEGSGDRIKRTPSRMSRQSSRKRKVNTIVLTDADFAGARTISDNDFSEFEEDEEDEEVRGVLKEGILVSELPFKPKADIGDLARITAEEFCPLTPEDEASCGEITTWP